MTSPPPSSAPDRFTWRDFWNRDNPIYVSERHKALHYKLVAADIAELVPHPGAHVLDHGCGEALSAARIAAVCARLYLCDAAPSVVERLKQRFVGEPRIAPLLADELATVPDASLDLVVANSLVQYIGRLEFRALLELWRSKLRPGGRLVVADVIRPDTGPLTDALALLRFGWRGGFLLAAVTGLIRTALSDYRKLRAALGLSTYTQAEMETLIEDAGFAAVRRRDRNLGHNAARMTFTAQA